MFYPTSKDDPVDVVTHILSGTSTARLLTGSHRRVRAPMLAATFGSLFPDVDFWLYWVGPEFFGSYHRMVSHSIPGLLIVSLVAGSLAWWISHRAWFRRVPMGFVPGVEPRSQDIATSWTQCILFAAWAAHLHFWFDWITGWGLMPFWPFSSVDYSLKAVSSFDSIVWGLTLAFWAVLHITLRTNTSEAAPIKSTHRFMGVAYVIILAAYVILKWSTGERSIL